MRRIASTVLVGLLFATTGTVFGQTFLANNGVMYGTGESKVIVDGLFRFYRDIYPPLPDSLRIPLESAEPPFGQAAFILATHQHGDHMHPAAMGSYLCRSPDTVALVPDQIRDEIIDAADCKLDPARLVSHAGAVERRGIRIRAVPVPHVRPNRFSDLDNRAYVIETENKRIVHLGDSDLSEALVDEPIDVLSTPYWNIGDADFMRLWERAQRPLLIAVHVSPGDHERLRRRYQNLDLAVWVPETALAPIPVGKTK